MQRGNREAEWRRCVRSASTHRCPCWCRRGVCEAEGGSSNWIESNWSAVKPAVPNRWRPWRWSLPWLFLLAAALVQGEVLRIRCPWPALAETVVQFFWSDGTRCRWWTPHGTHISTEEWPIREMSGFRRAQRAAGGARRQLRLWLARLHHPP